MNRRLICTGSLFGISVLLIVPDILIFLLNNSSLFSKSMGSFIFIIAVSIAFLTNRNKKLAIFLATFLSIIQFVQLCCVKYFGTFISPASLHLMTKETSDVLEEAAYLFWNYIYLLVISGGSFFLIYKVSLYAKKYGCKSTYAPLVFSSIAIFLSIHSEGYAPNGIYFSLENSIRAFIGYVHFTATKQKVRNYKPYFIKQVKNIDEPMTIVYILGESTNCEHMSLFGYKEDTTPELNKLARASNFYHTIGIAGAVTTISSCKFMLNAIKEPDNITATSLDTTNLFKLAKQSGFKTFYISAQSNDLLSSIGGIPYIDVLITRERHATHFSHERDSFLFEILREQKYEDKNFVVIHQRCIHSPYKKTVPKSFLAHKKFKSNKNQKINEYDDAIFYNDSIISGLFKMFNRQNGKYYIFFASDHNELMGKEKLWGHGILNPETARIPVLIQSNDETFLRKIKTVFAITHYDICCAVANLLGYEITNPNEEKDIYYINGVDYIGRGGYIKFRKDHKNKKIAYFAD